MIVNKATDDGNIGDEEKQSREKYLIRVVEVEIDDQSEQRMTPRARQIV